MEQVHKELSTEWTGSMYTFKKIYNLTKKNTNDKMYKYTN